MSDHADHIALLNRRIDIEKARADAAESVLRSREERALRAEAEAAALRGVLVDLMTEPIPPSGVAVTLTPDGFARATDRFAAARSALSSDAGKRFLETMERWEKLLAVAADALENLAEFHIVRDIRKELEP